MSLPTTTRDSFTKEEKKLFPVISKLLNLPRKTLYEAPPRYRESTCRTSAIFTDEHRHLGLIAVLLAVLRLDWKNDWRNRDSNTYYCSTILFRIDDRFAPEKAGALI